MTDMFQNLLRVFTGHQFEIKMQYIHYRKLKKTMKSHECLIHMDFSENYACIVSRDSSNSTLYPLSRRASRKAHGASLKQATENVLQMEWVWFYKEQ